MDQFLSKLNLQNLLRQFCCGIVFFVPLYLFVPCQIKSFWYHAGLADKYITCIAGLSLIIGTIVYHLEKNLYSYTIQTIFETFKCCSLLKAFTSILILIYFIILCFKIALPFEYALTVFFSILYAFGLVCTIYSKKRRLIIRTERYWQIENDVENNSRQAAIAKKVSVWSDFIHCTQSCCFSWILGTIVARYCGSRLQDDIIAKMNICVSLVLLLLSIELFIDSHRYIHVRRMTRGIHVKETK